MMGQRSAARAQEGSVNRVARLGFFMTRLSNPERSLSDG